MIHFFNFARNGLKQLSFQLKQSMSMSLAATVVTSKSEIRRVFLFGFTGRRLLRIV